MSSITCKFCQAIMPKNQLKLHLATFHKGERLSRNISKPSSTVVSKSSAHNMDLSDFASSLLAAIRKPSTAVSSVASHVQDINPSSIDAMKRSRDMLDEDEQPTKKRRFEYSEICTEHSGLTSCFYHRCQVLHDFLAYAKNPQYAQFCVNHVNASACFSQSECCDSIWDWLTNNGFVTRNEVKKLIKEAVVTLGDVWKKEMHAEMEKDKRNFMFIFHAIWFYVVSIHFFFFYSSMRT